MSLAANITWFCIEVFSLPTFPVFCIYLFMVAGSYQWQKYTKPLQLKMILLTYNMICSGLSFVTLVGFIYGIFYKPFTSQLTLSSVTQRIYEIQSDSSMLGMWFTLYCASKVLELYDTVFMILRHKGRQITFLHVYHHASMLVLSDMARQPKYNWPSIAVILAINSAVHVLMYFYYFLCAYNPGGTRPSWRQRLTEIQILQFLIDSIFATFGYLYYGFCIYGLIYGFIMIALFANFYHHAYIRKKHKKQ